MVNSQSIECSGLRVSVESSEQLPAHVMNQVIDTMFDIARLLRGPPKDLSQAESNLELFTLVVSCGIHQGLMYLIS